MRAWECWVALELIVGKFYFFQLITSILWWLFFIIKLKPQLTLSKVQTQISYLMIRNFTSKLARTHMVANKLKKQFFGFLQMSHSGVFTIWTINSMYILFVNNLVPASIVFVNSFLYKSHKWFFFFFFFHFSV